MLVISVFTNWNTWSLILEVHAWLGSQAQFSQFITPFNAFLLVPMKYTVSTSREYPLPEKVEEKW